MKGELCLKSVRKPPVAWSFDCNPISALVKNQSFALSLNAFGPTPSERSGRLGHQGLEELQNRFGLGSGAPRVRMRSPRCENLGATRRLKRPVLRTGFRFLPRHSCRSEGDAGSVCPITLFEVYPHVERSLGRPASMQRREAPKGR